MPSLAIQVTPGYFGEGATFPVDGFSCQGVLERVIGNDTDLQEDFTIDMAFRWRGTGLPGISSARFYYLNPNTGEFPWRLTILLGSGEFIISLHTNPAGESLTEAATFTTATDDTDWHHVAVSYDRTGNVVIYLEGLEVFSGTVPFSDVSITPDAANLIHIADESFAHAFDLDNVRFVNAVDDPADILDRATNGLPGD